MQNFQYAKAAKDSVPAKFPEGIRFLAGGTTLIDLMKLDVEKPSSVLDVNALPYAEIKKDQSLIRIGALVKNAALAADPLIQKTYPVLAKALLSGASAQLRNKATTAGNLLQRTRCPYFRDVTKACNKRKPGSGCAAIAGNNRNLAILGTSSACIATNPSDMNVALMAASAKIEIVNKQDKRTEDIAQFFKLPGQTPHIENTLRPGDFITHVSLPELSEETRQAYLKLRDRASYEFALSSAAIILKLSGSVISKVQIAMGGIGTVPWRAQAAEAILLGNKPSEKLFQAAATATLKDAQPQTLNGFKVELAKRCLIQALKETCA